MRTVIYLIFNLFLAAKEEKPATSTVVVLQNQSPATTKVMRVINNNYLLFKEYIFRYICLSVHFHSARLLHLS